MEYFIGERRIEICCALEDDVPCGDDMKHQIQKVLPIPYSQVPPKVNIIKKLVEDEKKTSSLEEVVNKRHAGNVDLWGQNFI